MGKNLVAVLLMVMAAAALWLAWSMRHASEFHYTISQPTSTPASESAPTTAVHNTGDSIEVTAPAPNTLIHSPLKVLGRAKNPWFFEGQFPVELIDSAGTILAKAPAQAQGDWTGSDFISFSLMLNFPRPTTTAGLLILQNDNPSGDPSRDIILAIPVRFK